MAKCKNCKNLLAKEEISIGHLHSYRWCPVINDNPDIERERDCYDYECMTNADKIRSMTDEELYQVLLYLNREFLIDGDKLKAWLKSEVGCE